jgi:large subunit ribosomal protein L29
MATAKELRDLTVDDLNRRATELRDTLFQDQLKLRTGALDNPAERTVHKRDLARVLTVLTEKNKATVAKKPAPKKAKA